MRCDFKEGAFGWATHAGAIRAMGRTPIHLDKCTDVIVLDEDVFSSQAFALVLSPTRDCSKRGEHIHWNLAGIPVQGVVGWVPQSVLEIVKISIPLWQMKISRIDSTNVCVESELSFVAARMRVNSHGEVITLV